MLVLPMRQSAVRRGSRAGFARASGYSTLPSPAVLRPLQVAAGRTSTVTAGTVHGCHALEAVRKTSEVLFDRLEQPHALTPVRLGARVLMLGGRERCEL